MTEKPDGSSCRPHADDAYCPFDNPVSEVSRREFIAMSGLALVASSTGAPAAAQTTGSLPPGQELIPVSLHVNGRIHPLKVDTRVTLLDALRNDIGLTGPKKGCDHGQCGACTVLVDGRRIYSCLTLAVMQTETPIVTIEGLASGEELSPLQTQFVKHDAFQCGYCTPGQICSATGLLGEGRAHSDAEVRELMSGNLCRCGCYNNIIKAIQAVNPRHNQATDKCSNN